MEQNVVITSKNVQEMKWNQTKETTSHSLCISFSSSFPICTMVEVGNALHWALEMLIIFCSCIKEWGNQTYTQKTPFTFKTIFFWFSHIFYFNTREWEKKKHKQDTEVSFFRWAESSSIRRTYHRQKNCIKENLFHISDPYFGWKRKRTHIHDREGKKCKYIQDTWEKCCL